MNSADQTNKILHHMIKRETPFFVGRFGGFELAIVIKCLQNNLRMKSELVEKFRNNAGFYSISEENIYRFAELMLESTKELDLIGRFWNGMEDYVIRAYAPSADITHMYFLEPWYDGVTIPWTSALEGKRVLIIHPFETTIKSQFNKRQYLFKNSKILPQFELLTLKAVQTIAGEKDSRFVDWYEALDYMYQSALNINFDIAIIGCGAYGFPLAAKLKRAGKCAIHMGGATQLLFGIKGSRWENEPQYDYVRRQMNSYWTYPLRIDCIVNSENVENSCYWGRSSK